ncbi:MAG: glycosyltransferase family 4 protein [Legionellales bacterium]
MKIRILIDAKQIGGVETHVMNLCEALALRHHEVILIFVCAYSNNGLYALCEQRGINYLSCRSFAHLKQILDESNPDIIHAHGYKANIYARLVGLMDKIPVVTTFHAGEKPVGRLIVYNALDRWSSFFSNNICVNSRIARSLPTKATLIPNFVDVPSPNTLRDSKPFAIYFIGRVSPEKGPLEFCQLAEKSDSNALTWHMVGTGPLIEACKSRYSNAVQFHGAVGAMDGIWPKVDLLCITSFYEGLPLVLLEAMSRGIPVISFDVGSVKEVLSEPDCIIACYDLEGMKKSIGAYFAKTLQERQAMANRAIQKIRSYFSREVVVPEIESFYQKCIRSF